MATGCCAQVNTKPGARRGKKAGKKKKDEAAEAEDLDDDEQTQHDQEIEDAAGGLHSSLCICSEHTHGTCTAGVHVPVITWFLSHCLLTPLTSPKDRKCKSIE